MREISCLGGSNFNCTGPPSDESLLMEANLAINFPGSPRKGSSATHSRVGLATAVRKPSSFHEHSSEHSDAILRPMRVPGIMTFEVVTCFIMPLSGSFPTCVSQNNFDYKAEHKKHYMFFKARGKMAKDWKRIGKNA